MELKYGSTYRNLVSTTEPLSKKKYCAFTQKCEEMLLLLGELTFALTTPKGGRAHP